MSSTDLLTAQARTRARPRRGRCPSASAGAAYRGRRGSRRPRCRADATAHARTALSPGPRRGGQPPGTASWGFNSVSWGFNSGFHGHLGRFAGPRRRGKCRAAAEGRYRAVLMIKRSEAAAAVRPGPVARPPPRPILAFPQVTRPDRPRGPGAAASFACGSRPRPVLSRSTWEWRRGMYHHGRGSSPPRTPKPGKFPAKQT